MFLWFRDMDDQNGQKKSSFSGVEGENSKKNSKITWEFVVRLLGLILSLVAATVLGADKQTKIVSLRIVSTLPPVDIPFTAKSSLLSAFVYNIATNAIACTYATISMLILVVTRRKSHRGLAVAVMAADLVVVALLFSGTGAAGAIGLIGYQGNSHVMWRKVCYVFESFCARVAASLVLSLLGSVVFLSLVVFDAMRLHNIPK